MPEKLPAKPADTSVILDLKDTALGLTKLAQSVEQFPGRMAVEVSLVKESFWSGAGFGFVVGMLFLLALVVLFDRRR